MPNNEYILKLASLHCKNTGVKNNTIGVVRGPHQKKLTPVYRCQIVGVISTPCSVILTTATVKNNTVSVNVTL